MRNPRHAVPTGGVGDLGGVLYVLLRHAFERLTDDDEAFIGYCGEARAEQVGLQAGFRHTHHEHLLA